MFKPVLLIILFKPDHNNGDQPRNTTKRQHNILIFLRTRPNNLIIHRLYIKIIVQNLVCPPFLPVSAITERRDMGLYEVPLSLFCFGMGTMLANFHMCGFMLVLRAVFNMLVRNASPFCA